MFEFGNAIVVASTTLAALFRGDEIVASDGSRIHGMLHLPEYQRPYCWAEKQLARLQDDLCQFFGGEHRTLAPSHDFYLGSIILHQERNKAGDWVQLNIIDGQQRLTTMALLAHCLGMEQYVPELMYIAPESQARIRNNLRWMKRATLPLVDFERVNITLVVTRSEDDAYRFFETQNTGGVRLGGPDIIKAHHLRAVVRTRQNEYASRWENMGDLKPLVDVLMRPRHWQALEFRDLAGHRDRLSVRNEIVEELAERTGKKTLDLAYRQVQFHHTSDGWSQRLAAGGYAMRQPLNAGVNAIHYLEYFHALRQQLLVAQSEPELGEFYAIYRGLVVAANGSAYLRKLYDSAILLYVSQFGCVQLFEAGLWLFRAVYSPRLSNQRVVKESTVQLFARESRLLDWIAGSYSHEQLVLFLQGFAYKVDASNLDKKANGIKSRFVREVQRQLAMPPLSDSGNDVAQVYDDALCAAIRAKTTKLSVLGGAA